MHKIIEISQRASRQTNFPIILLILANLAAGLLTYRDYGLSWDEPLFYDYADSIRLAYTPQAFSPAFDFEQVYGPSAADHKYYGPAYLLIARPFEQAVMALPGADRASAWHLVNFLTFQLGLLFFYLLLRRRLDPWPAAMATAFFGWQPALWGHAFINPKDAPLMAFFIISVTLGLRMVDRFSNTLKQAGWLQIAIAGFVLGATASIRVIGPLAGVFTLAYFLTQKKWRALPAFIAYGLVSMLGMYLLWPFLWAAPLQRLAEVLHYVSNNPTEAKVLFIGQLFTVPTLPRRYLAQMLAITMTEPTFFLFFFGLALAAIRTWRKKEWSIPIIIGWFVLMMAYVLVVNPPSNDGIRHFLFILPPVFVAAGFVFQFLYEKLRSRMVWGAVCALLLIPGLLGIVRLQPYAYTYYNTFVGGTGGAYRNYETDYWLTCYKESLEWVRANRPGATVHIQREPMLAAYYADGLTLKDLGPETEADIPPGDLLLFSTRGDLDVRSIFRKVPVLYTIGRDGADFCLIKEK